MVSCKYSKDDRKEIVQSIENLKNDKDYIAIFEILSHDDNHAYTVNSNGIFLNLSSTSDEILSKVKKYLSKIHRRKNNNIETDIDIIPNINVTKSSRVYKLSNYEKNILKSRTAKSVTNDILIKSKAEKKLNKSIKIDV